MRFSYRKRGFTILELIIAITILSIVLAAIFGFNIFGIKTYAVGESQWNVQIDVRNLSDLITRQVRYASEVELTNQTPALNDGYNYIRSEGNSVRYYQNGALVSSFPSTASNSMSIKSDFTGSSGNILSFNIKGTEINKGRNYSIASKVICLNLSDDLPIKITSGNYNIRYRINQSIVNLFATPGDGKVDLVFTKPVEATSVKLYMSSGSASNFFQVAGITLSSNSTTVSVTGLTNGTQYWFKLTVVGGDFDGDSNIVTATPFKPAELTATEVADAITSISSQSAGALSLSIPSVPNGFDISIKSTSNSSVITTNGDIATPSSDTTVNIIFTIRKNSDGTTADTASIPVLVKALPSGVSNVGIKVSLGQLTNTTTDMDFRINGIKWEDCKSLFTSVGKIENDCVIEVRKNEDIQTSNYKVFNLQQPSAPAVSFEITKNKNFGIFKYDISLEKSLEYSTSLNGGNWLNVSSKEININKISVIIVRKKATDSELPSKSIKVY